MRFRGVLHAKGVQILTRGAFVFAIASAPTLHAGRRDAAEKTLPLAGANANPPKTKTTNTPKQPSKTAFLPTLEKFGRTAQLLLSPTEVHLVQTGLNTDGPHVTARFDAATLFVVAGGAYRVSSRHHDLIAVSLDVALLAKALRSAAAAAAQAAEGSGAGQQGAGAGVVDVRLTQRAVPAATGAAADGGGGAGGGARPFLAFGVRGALSQDLPVSRPFGPAEVDRLAGAKDVAELCDYYVDLAGCGVRWLRSLCERLRCVAGGGVGAVATAASGDLHVSTAAGGGGAGGAPLLGTLVQGLRVLPAS